LPAGVDYDELARRLLVQVVRRLAATPGDLEQTVAGLERELATALTSHGTLTAENVRLREQLTQTQRDLDLARELNRKAAVSTELSQAEVVLLDGLLTPRRENDEQESGATTGLTRRRSRAGAASRGD
jgi:regulator of replication initiation timing